MTGFTSEAILFNACNASFALGKSFRCEYERTKGSISGMATNLVRVAKQALTVERRSDGTWVYKTIRRDEGDAQKLIMDSLVLYLGFLPQNGWHEAIT
jgi:hypothetical protein